MELDFFSQGKEYISASRAAKKTGYASDYIGQLCRGGKIPGKLIDRTWYVDLESLLAHKRTRELGRPRRAPSLESPKTKVPTVLKIQARPLEIITASPVENLPLEYTEAAVPLLPLIAKELPSKGTSLRARIVPARAYLVAAMATVLVITAALSLPQSLAKQGERLAMQASVAEATAISFFGILSDSAEFLSEGFRNLHDLAFGPSEAPATSSPSNLFSSKVEIATTTVAPESFQALTQTTSSIDSSSFKSSLKAELESYIRAEISNLASPEARIVYLSPTVNTTVLREDILLADTRPTVTRQSTSDIDHLSNALTELTNGGSLANVSISGGSLTGITFASFTSLSAASGEISSLTFGNALGTNATSTNFFATTASSTNLFSTGAHFSSLLFENATGTNATTTNLFSTAANLSFLSFGNAVGTNATTTNLFATTASSTNLISSQASFGEATSTTFAITGNGSGLMFSGSGTHDIIASSGTLRIGANTVIGNVTPLDSSISIGGAGNRFDKIYADEVNANTIVGTISGGNVTASSMRINSDNATADTEDAFLEFERGTLIPNALFTWDSTNDRFTLNAPLALTGGIGNGDFLATGSSTLQNFTFVRATGTAATTTNSFATTASSTNLFSSLLTVGGTALVVDASRNVGIGTTSPIGTLEVTNAASGPALRVVQDSQYNSEGALGVRILEKNLGTAMHMGVDAIGDFGFIQAMQPLTSFSSRALVLQGNGGNVGIGTTTPTSKLHVAAATGSNILTLENTSAAIASGDTLGIINFTTDDVSSITNREAASIRAIADGVFAGDTASTALTFWTHVNGSTASAERMRIDNAGNVGIGTSTPQAVLHTVGQIRSSVADDTTAFRITEADGVTNAISLYRDTNNAFTLDVGSASRALVVNTSGNVGIGTTTPTWLLNPSSATAAQLALSSGAGQAQWAFRAAGNNLYVASTTVAGTATTSTSALSIVGTTGNVGIGTNAPNQKLEVNGLARFTGSGAFSIGTDSGQNRIDTSGAVGNGNQIFRLLSSSDALAGLRLKELSVGATFGLLDAPANGAIFQGQVGIGTSTPIATLNVTGNGDYLADSTNNGITITNAGTPTERLHIGVDSTLGTNGSAYIQSLRSGTAVTPLLLNARGGNVGIATTTPTSLLDLQSSNSTNAFTIHGTTNQSLLSTSRLTLNAGWGTTNGSYIDGIAGILTLNSSSNGLALGTAGTVHATLTSTGNLGIGTTTAGNKLVITQTVSAGATTAGLTLDGLYNSATSIQTIDFLVNGNTSFPAARIGNPVNGGVNSPALAFYTAASASTLAAERMRIDNSGNVGIGTSTPSSILTVHGSSNQLQVNTTATDARIQLTAASVNSAFLNYNTTTGFALGTQSGAAATPVTFQTAGADRLTINASGNVGIGTTTPNNMLDIFSATKAAIGFSGASGSTYKWTMGMDVTNAGRFAIASSTALGTLDRLVIDGNGNVGIGTTTPSVRLSVATAGATIGFTVQSIQGNTAGAVALGSFSSAGRIQALTNDNVLTASAATLLLNDSGGKVAIGTTTPNNVLDLYSATKAAVSFTGGTTAGQWTMGYDVSNGRFAIASSTALGTTDRLVINGAGNVGIGTTAPTANLFVSKSFAEPTGGISSTTVAVFSNSGNANGTSSISILSRSSAATSLNFGTQLEEISGQISYFRSSPVNTRAPVAGSMIFSTLGIDRMLIDGNGNVGIGTSTPANKLDVLGDVMLGTGVAAATLKFVDGNSWANVRTISDTGTSLAFTNSESGGSFDFQMNAAGTDHFNITSGANILFKVRDDSGNVGVSSTTPYAKLSVSGFTTGTPGIVADALSGFTGNLLDLKVASTTKFSVNQAGDVYMTGSTTLQNITYVNATSTNATTTNFFSTTASSTNLFASIASIGTSVLSEKLTVAGGNIKIDAATAGTSDRWIGVNANNSFLVDTNNGSVFNSSANMYFNVDADNNDSDTRNFIWGKNAATTAGTELMRLTEAGNVGIGTTTPGTGGVGAGTGKHLTITGASSPGRLHLNTDASAGAFYGTTFSSNNNGDLDVTSFGNMAFRTNQSNNNSLYLNTSGNAGIGTTTPNNKLDLFSSTKAAISFTGGTTAGQWTMGYDVSNGRFAIASSTALGTLDRFVIDGNGNVGIGTTTPVAKLGVYNTASPYASIFQGSSAAAVGIGSISGAGFIQALTNDSAVSTQNLALNHVGGKVAIGTTTPNNVLDLYSATKAAVSFTGGTTAGQWTMGYDVSNGRFAIASSTALGTTDRLVISGAGNVGIGSTTPSATLTVASSLTTGKTMVVEDTSVTSGRVFSVNGATGAGQTIGGSESTGIVYITGNIASQVIGVPNVAGLYSDVVLNPSTASAAGANAYFETTVSNTTNPSANWGTYSNLFDNTNLANVNYGSDAQITMSGAASKSAQASIANIIDTTSIGSTLYGGYFINTSSGTVTSGTQNSYGVSGLASTLNMNGATAVANIYGGYFLADGTVSSGTINTYGAYITNGTVSTAGTSTHTGLYVEAITGADRNFAAIFAGGNVGMGTTTPNNILDIYSTTKSAIGFSGASGSTYKWTLGMDVTNGGRFSIASSTALGSVDRFVIDGNGNVGIGTTAPLNSNRFSVRGTGTYNWGGVSTSSDVMIASSEMTDGADHSILQLTAVRTAVGTNSKGFLGFSLIDDSNDSGVYDAGRIQIVNETAAVFSPSALSFWTNTNPAAATTPATEKMRLTSGGLLGIGTTNPGQQLTVAQGVAFLGVANGAGTAYLCTTLATGVVSTSTTACNPSSLKYKDNVENLSYGLDTVLNLRPVSYDYKPELLVDGHQIGFIAEEMYEEVPEVVGLDQEGNPNNIDYAKLTSVLTRAIQEVAHITGTFKDNLIAWLGDAANGIEDFFANRVHTQELCVGDGGGETCVNKAQLDLLLASAGMSGTQTTGGGGSGSGSTIGDLEIVPPTDGGEASSTPDVIGGDDSGAASSTPETIEEPPAPEEPDAPSEDGADQAAAPEEQTEG